MDKSTLSEESLSLLTEYSLSTRYLAHSVSYSGFMFSGAEPSTAALFSIFSASRLKKPYPRETSSGWGKSFMKIIWQRYMSSLFRAIFSLKFPPVGVY